MAYSYLTKLYLETELCIQEATTWGDLGLLKALMAISHKQVGDAIMEER